MLHNNVQKILKLHSVATLDGHLLVLGAILHVMDDHRFPNVYCRSLGHSNLRTLLAATMPSTRISIAIWTHQY